MLVFHLGSDPRLVIAKVRSAAMLIGCLLKGAESAENEGIFWSCVVVPPPGPVLFAAWRELWPPTQWT